VGLLLLSGLGWLLTLAGRRQREIEEANRAVARAEQRIRTIADSVPALVAYVDRDGRYQFTNAYYRNMYGADPTSFIGRPVREVLGEAAYGELQPHIEAVMAGEPRRFERHAREHGLDIHLLSNYEPDRDEQGRVVGFHVMSLDITERKRAEMRQAQSERRLRLIADNVPALISHLDAHGRYLYANQQFQRLLGIEPDRLAGQPLAQVRDAAYVAQVTSAMQTVLDGQEVSFETQLVLNGTMHHFQQNYVPDVDAQGRVAGFYSITFDVTHLKDVERRLSAMARTDPLTGLPNRLHFHEKIREAQARQRRSLAGLALLYLDVDRFKRINDVHGHAMGDAVLKEFARRLRAGVRETDTVARLAGDEFVVILEGVLRAGDACEVANKVLANFDPLFELDGESLSVSPSIGIVVDESGSMEPDELLAAADDALYQAKRLGRRRARLWQPAVEAVDG
jgi:diguanylate cyclase (GGDEF)-like protein/PAS domain S-box-containing protein